MTNKIVVTTQAKVTFEEGGLWHIADDKWLSAPMHNSDRITRGITSDKVFFTICDDAALTPVGSIYPQPVRMIYRIDFERLAEAGTIKSGTRS